MQNQEVEGETLSLFWKRAVILVLIVGFGVLIWIAINSYSDAPPIPIKVVNQSGETIFTREDILAGQQVFRCDLHLVGGRSIINFHGPNLSICKESSINGSRKNATSTRTIKRPSRMSPP